MVLFEKIDLATRQRKAPEITPEHGENNRTKLPENVPENDLCPLPFVLYVDRSVVKNRGGR